MLGLSPVSQGAHQQLGKSASTFKRAMEEPQASLIAHICATWTCLLCRLSSGTSSSRILVGRFSWGNLQDKGNGKDQGPKAVHQIEAAADPACLLPFQSPSSTAGHSVGLCGLPQGRPGFSPRGTEPRSPGSCASMYHQTWTVSISPWPPWG